MIAWYISSNVPIFVINGWIGCLGDRSSKNEQRVVYVCLYGVCKIGKWSPPPKKTYLLSVVLQVNI